MVLKKKRDEESQELAGSGDYDTTPCAVGALFPKHDGIGLE
jgi:hypothetical protein